MTLCEKSSDYCGDTCKENCPYDPRDVRCVLFDRCHTPGCTHRIPHAPNEDCGRDSHCLGVDCGAVCEEVQE
jgi:hypothetical protein